MVREVLICTACGNTDTFKGTVNENTYYNNVVFDKYGNIIEINDPKYSEIDNTDIDFCGYCKDEGIITIKESELDEYVYKHTRKDNTWSQDELPVEERNKELFDKLIVDKI